MYTQKISEDLAVLAVANPALVDNAAVATGWVKLDKAQRALALFVVGATDIGITSILVQEATDGSGTGAATLKSATNLTATDDNKQVLINVDAAELSNGYSHVRFTATVGDGTVGAQVCAVILGACTRWKPASMFNAASVTQVVA